MIVSMITNAGFFTLTLPEKMTGQYWLSIKRDEKIVRGLCIEGNNQTWILKSTSRVDLIDVDVQGAKRIIKEEKLEANRMFPFMVKETGEEGVVFCEPSSADRCVFHRYQINGNTSISIGRKTTNEICYQESVVSGVHAVLTYQNGAWSIKDKGSTNGTFVNGKSVQDMSLSYGDMIYILGLKIVVGKDCLAVNNPGGHIQVSIPKASEPEKFIYLPAARTEDMPDDLDEKPSYYSRSPRFKQEIEPPTIKIDSPPQNQMGQELPWPLVTMSSVTMGTMSFVTIASAIATFNVLSLISGIAMLIGTILLPNITKSYERKRKQEREALRQEKYAAYLDGIRNEINGVIANQEQILRANYVPVEECERRILSVDQTLWNRDASQNDFLKLRIGTGTEKLDATIQYPERHFTLDDDNLSEELLKLGEEEKLLRNVPITVSLKDDYVAGIIGKPEVANEFALGLIFQIAAFYSYDEVKMVFLFDSLHRAPGFVKWLPHVWDDAKTIRFIAETPEENKELSAYFETVIETRIALDDESRKKVSPHYVIFDFSKENSETSEMMKKLYRAQKELGISVVSVRQDFAELPKDCRAVIQIDNRDQASVFDRSNISGAVKPVKPDIYLNNSPMELAKVLANVKLDISSAGSNLPKMLSFLEMYGVGMIEHLNPETRWVENDPTKSLQAPVGVGADGNLFYLDLHEKYHGPHGLVAGMTGSGKSEFIITYILSLAVNYRPEEVAFVLIDYKGGGLAGAFEDATRGIRLPHLVGTITNLDGAMVNRSLISIQSELRRRQAVFNEARHTTNEGTMDIYKYQKLYREHVVKEPVPHLFIISDEFAELKSQQPEFMDQLISAARIGRSLGVHLILATQKPSGVVDDQIWSNSKFRVCLKVQERADSMDMIKRPDAASLVDTGRFYLQVGYNEYFDLGQSAWCGGIYEPSEHVQKNIDNSIRIVDRMGRVIRELKPAPLKTVRGQNKKQIVAIVEYLSKIAKEEKIQSRNLWLDPIPEVILTDALREKYHYQPEPYVMNPVIGEYDDPYNQMQGILTLPITKNGNVIIYGTEGSGKELLLHSLIYSLLKDHNAAELNMYLLDFGAETLFSYQNAPQVGGVVLSSDDDKMMNLLNLLLDEYESRKQKFAKYGGSYTLYREETGKSLPNIVVVLNNYTVFWRRFSYSGNVTDGLIKIVQAGSKYGIHFVMTSSSTSIDSKLVDGFKQRYAMQMNDRSDYTGIFGTIVDIMPSKIYGRGLLKTDKAYEFQAAHTTEQSNQIIFNQRFCEQLAASADLDLFEKPMLTIPKNIDTNFAAQYMNGLAKVPVGMTYRKPTMSTLSVNKMVRIPLLAEDVSLTASQAEAMAKLLSGLSGVKVTVLDPDPEGLFSDGMENVRLVRMYDILTYLDELLQEVAERFKKYKKSEEAGQSGAASMEAYEEQVIVFAGLNDICDILDDDGLNKLKGIFNYSEAYHKLHYIICDSMSGWSKRFAQIIKKDKEKTRAKLTEAIWVGGGFGDISVRGQFDIGSETLKTELDSEDGLVIKNGHMERVRLLTYVKNTEEGEWEDE